MADHFPEAKEVSCGKESEINYTDRGMGGGREQKTLQFRHAITEMKMGQGNNQPLVMMKDNRDRDKETEGMGMCVVM